MLETARSLPLDMDAVLQRSLQHNAVAALHEARGQPSASSRCRCPVGCPAADAPVVQQLEAMWAQLQTQAPAVQQQRQQLSIGTSAPACGLHHSQQRHASLDSVQMPLTAPAPSPEARAVSQQHAAVAAAPLQRAASMPSLPTPPLECPGRPQRRRLRLVPLPNVNADFEAAAAAIAAMASGPAAQPAGGRAADVTAISLASTPAAAVCAEPSSPASKPADGKVSNGAGSGGDDTSDPISGSLHGGVVARIGSPAGAPGPAGAQASELAPSQQVQSHSASPAAGRASGAVCMLNPAQAAHLL